ncbi:hypothetical protein RUND412_006793 [Rhizina undulata]
MNVLWSISAIRYVLNETTAAREEVRRKEIRTSGSFMFASADGQRRQDRRRPLVRRVKRSRWKIQEFEAKSWWSAEEDTALRARLRKEILHSFCKTEKGKKPPIGSLFMEVFEKPSENIVEQMRELRGVMVRFPDECQLSDYEGGKDSLNIPK